jgi:predicted lipoprotein with Yx(FWY)xxD motif
MSASTLNRPRFAGGWLPAAALLGGLVLILAACSAAATATPPESEAALESTAASESESAEPSESEAAGMTAEITVVETSAGSALAGEGGMTLYTFDNDSGGESSCYDECATNWPPFLVEGGAEATAGEGVTGDIGVTSRTDGDVQVTYNDAPLYYFAGDSAPGDATGDGVGGVWHIAIP